MAGRPWTEDEKQTASRLKAQGRNAVEIGEELDRSASSVRNYFRDNGIEFQSIKRLFIDIETSPCIGFFWRPGYRLSISYENIIRENAIICICWKWESSSQVHSAEWDRGNDKPALETFMQEANNADEVIAHNGDGFDIPWINARCLAHGLGPIPAKSVDTLKILRRRFKFNSNRLDYIAQHLLGEGKIRTDFDLWKDIVLNNCPKAMTKMVHYCKQDVALLQRVWEKLHPFDVPKSHAGVIAGGGRWTCPHDGSEYVTKFKELTTTKGSRQYQMRCNVCSRYFVISDTVHREFSKAN